jgi:putative ABC transport system permease protein
MMQGSSPALKLLWRDARSGELNLLIASLILAVATVTCINLFTDRIQRSISAEASSLLAADVQVRGNQPIPPEWQRRATGLATADIISFRAMAIAGAEMQLVSIKAVGDAYPLKGNLEVAEEPYGVGITVEHGPSPGEAWLASRLFAALNIAVGDSITIGNARFTVSAALLREPDNNGRLFGGGARVMINTVDVPETGAVQVGSRVDYRWLLAGSSQSLANLRRWLEPQLGPHFSWVTPEDGSLGVGEAMGRSENFLLLAGSLAVVLAGAALALASRRYASRQQGVVALLKTLGMTPRRVLWLYLNNILMLGILTTAIGLSLGWLLHILIVMLVGHVLPSTLAPAGIMAYLTGACVGILVLVAFAAPPLLALRNVPPVSVLRRTASQTSSLWHGLPGVMAIVILIFGYSQSLKLTVFILLGGSLAMLGVALLANILVRLCALLARRLRKGYRLGLANLYRHRRYNRAQIMLFAVLLLLLFVLYALRTSMLSDWRQQLPADSPNHFAFNIFSGEKATIEALFRQNDVETTPFYPMVRGRLVRVNGEDAKQRAASEEGSEPEDDRELNLTWAAEMGTDNRIVAGTWWPSNAIKSDELLVSFEKSYAETYKVSVGDMISVSLSGDTRRARVTSIRTVQWDSMRPNFYLIFNKPLVDESAANWLTSFYLPADKKEFVNTLSRRFPTVSLIELDQMINQIQSIIRQVSRAVEFILALTVGAGILVLVASIQATLDIRLHESALLRALGASRRLVFTSLLIEFGVMGLLAGMMGALGAETSLYFLQTRTFNMSFSPHWELWLAGPILGILLVGSVGLFSSASVVRVPPLTVLRKM